MRLGWNNFTSFSFLLHFEEKMEFYIGNILKHANTSREMGRPANASPEAETSKRESTEGEN